MDTKPAKFRETMWFKMGAAGPEPTEAPTSDAVTASDADDPTEAAAANTNRPIEDRYLDDGSVSRADSLTFGMHTGSKEYLAVVPESPTASSAPRDAADLRTLVGELKRTRRRALAVIGAGVASMGALLLLYAT
ncbi:MAG: hypothetical protein M3680_00295 [Myxococcota bacterium]|nr:hypothetical protein [Myxococcota bacterium]